MDYVLKKNFPLRINHGKSQSVKKKKFQKTNNNQKFIYSPSITTTGELAGSHWGGELKKYKSNNKTLSVNSLPKIDSFFNSNTIIPNSTSNRGQFELFVRNRTSYFKNSDLRIQNDINQLMERRKKEIELKDKEAEKERMEIVQKFREQEKAMEQKHSKKNIEIMLKYKPFLDKNLDKKSADYRYNQILEEYKDKEKKFLSKVKEKRHKLYNSDKYDEINEFQKKVDERKEKDDQRREIKRKEQLENWKSMKSSLPKCNFESVAEREQKRKEEEERRKQQAHALRVEKMNYGDNIRERRSPEINDGLKKSREKIIKTLENPKSAQVKYTLNKQKQNRIIIKKRDNTKPSKYKWKLKLEDSNSIEDEINNKLIKKPKKITTTYMATIPRTNSLATGKRPDYLRDIIAQKEEKKRNMSSENKNTEIDTVKDKEQKWEKTIKENKGTLMENISDVRDKITSLEKQAKMQEKLMRLNGGIGKNPKIGKKVSDLLIDSIEAKLSIINQINNN